MIIPGGRAAAAPVPAVGAAIGGTALANTPRYLLVDGKPPKRRRRHATPPPASPVAAVAAAALRDGVGRHAAAGGEADATKPAAADVWAAAAAADDGVCADEEYKMTATAAWAATATVADGGRSAQVVAADDKKAATSAADNKKAAAAVLTAAVAATAATCGRRGDQVFEVAVSAWAAQPPRAAVGGGRADRPLVLREHRDATVAVESGGESWGWAPPHPAAVVANGRAAVAASARAWQVGGGGGGGGGGDVGATNGADRVGGTASPPELSTLEKKPRRRSPRPPVDPRGDASTDTPGGSTGVAASRPALQPPPWRPAAGGAGAGWVIGEVVPPWGAGPAPRAAPHRAPAHGGSWLQGRASRGGGGGGGGGGCSGGVMKAETVGWALSTEASPQAVLREHRAQDNAGVPPSPWIPPRASAPPRWCGSPPAVAAASAPASQWELPDVRSGGGGSRYGARGSGGSGGGRAGGGSVRWTPPRCGPVTVERSLSSANVDGGVVADEASAATNGTAGCTMPAASGTVVTGAFPSHRCTPSPPRGSPPLPLRLPQVPVAWPLPPSPPPPARGMPLRVPPPAATGRVLPAATADVAAAAWSSLPSRRPRSPSAVAPSVNRRPEGWLPSAGAPPMALLPTVERLCWEEPARDSREVMAEEARHDWTLWPPRPLPTPLLRRLPVTATGPDRICDGRDRGGCGSGGGGGGGGVGGSGGAGWGGGDGRPTAAVAACDTRGDSVAEGGVWARPPQSMPASLAPRLPAATMALGGLVDRDAGEGGGSGGGGTPTAAGAADEGRLGMAARGGGEDAVWRPRPTPTPLRRRLPVATTEPDALGHDGGNCGGAGYGGDGGGGGATAPPAGGTRVVARGGNGSGWRPAEPSKRIACDLHGCAATFRRRSDLNRHKLFFHLNPRHHKCSYPGCRAAFNRFSFRRDHERTVHRGIKAYCCYRCPVLFGQRSSLTRHCIAAHGGVRETIADGRAPRGPVLPPSGHWGEGPPDAAAATPTPPAVAASVREAWELLLVQRRAHAARQGAELAAAVAAASGAAAAATVERAPGKVRVADGAATAQGAATTSSSSAGSGHRREGGSPSHPRRRHRAAATSRSGEQRQRSGRGGWRSDADEGATGDGTDVGEGSARSGSSDEEDNDGSWSGRGGRGADDGGHGGSRGLGGGGGCP
nr:PhM00001.1 [Neoporphyra haitanensis]